jgi:hypothetical protein
MSRMHAPPSSILSSVVFGIIVAVTFQSVFHMKIDQNNFFILKKN